MARKITDQEALNILDRTEGPFWDDKSAKLGGAKVQKIGCSFANTDGGEFAIGIEDRSQATGIERWQGFEEEEDGNFIHQALVQHCDPGVPYAVEWLEIEGQEQRGLVALVTVYKSASVHRTDAGTVWKRSGAQDLSLSGQQITDLSLSKGSSSYEDQMLEKYGADDLAAETELLSFLDSYSPATASVDFAKKQHLIDSDGRASVAAAVLYAETPAAVVPKKCAIKVARYETQDAAPTRDHLLGTPLTIEGPARVQIDVALEAVTKMVESVSVLTTDGTLQPVKYPPEALKEVIVNAVIHRDYNLSDDIQVWVFDNRIEVRSPGVLPGHMTRENILTERYARNATVVRLLNKYPDAPNKDIGEGLNTVFDKMKEARLREPTLEIDGSTFIVTLGHTPLARPEELIMKYLESHDEIKNSTARQLCGISSENTMKEVFYGLNKAGKLERTPGKSASASTWRKKP
ncbi:MAG: ATP-binding protein [Solirubrobacteraceae bacterium]